MNWGVPAIVNSGSQELPPIVSRTCHPFWGRYFLMRTQFTPIYISVDDASFCGSSKWLGELVQTIFSNATLWRGVPAVDHCTLWWWVILCEVTHNINELSLVSRLRKGSVLLAQNFSLFKTTCGVSPSKSSHGQITNWLGFLDQLRFVKADLWIYKSPPAGSVVLVAATTAQQRAHDTVCTCMYSYWFGYLPWNIWTICCGLYLISFKLFQPIPLWCSGHRRCTLCVHHASIQP